MMETTEGAATALEAVMIGGDLKALSPSQRLDWYRLRCEAAGLDPRSQPFQYLQLSGRLVLYATKAATDQLCARRGLSVEIISRGLTDGEIYEAVARVRDASGRVTEDLGAVSVAGLAGEPLVNAILKCVTKAKRRTILAHTGLGMLDETEVQGEGETKGWSEGEGETKGVGEGETGLSGSLPHSLTPSLPHPLSPSLPHSADPSLPHDLAYWRRRAMALYTELGGDTRDKDACRADFAAILAIEPCSRQLLGENDWRTIALNLDEQRQRQEAKAGEAIDLEDLGFEEIAAATAQQSGL